MFGQILSTPAPKTTTTAAKKDNKEVTIVLPGFITLRKDAAGNASRGLHRFSVKKDGIRTPLTVDAQFSQNYIKFLEAEAVRMGGELVDGGCIMMIPWYDSTDADYHTKHGSYTIPTVAICTELHNTAAEALQLRQLGKKTEAAQPVTAANNLVKPEDVPF